VSTAETTAPAAKTSPASAKAGSPGAAPAVARAQSGAEALVRCLEAEGVEYVFGLSGGAAIPIFDALVDSKIKLILVRHEQGATHMADGYARSSGKPGVVRPRRPTRPALRRSGKTASLPVSVPLWAWVMLRAERRELRCTL